MRRKSHDALPSQLAFAKAQMIDIGILEPHPVVRAGLRHLVSEQTGMRIVGEAASTDAAIAMVCSNPKLKVLVLELALPGQRGFDEMARIRAHAPGLPILVFSSHPATHYAMASIRHGARGFMNKDCAPQEIVVALRTLSVGRRFFSTALTGSFADQLVRSRKGAAHELLSVRETQVFHKLARGETPGGIAEAMALSIKTISTYRTRLLEKLSLSSNCDLTYYAVANELIA